MYHKAFKANDLIHKSLKAGDLTQMKRYVLLAFVIVLCGLMLQVTFVDAYRSGYEITNYLAMEDPVEDGKWTTSTEWTDAMTAPNLPASFVFREKWTFPGDILVHILVEFFTDNTNNTGDYFQLCFDPLANGGTAPQTDDILINYTGHSRSGLTLYKGNGTGWAVWTGWTYGTDIVIAETKTGSQLNGTAHWIIELMMDRSKPDFDASAGGYAPWLRVAVYDASNSAAGVQAWPPTSRDAPNDWGLETGIYATIPEFPASLTIVTVALLSSVAVVVGFCFLRKRPKTENHST
jgi:hypothetical protein